MNNIADYVPVDRRHALAKGIALPDRAVGTVLFADIAGFTLATEAIDRAFGPHRGAEELLAILNQIYDAFTAAIDRYRGSVVSFAGDGLTIWFDSDGEDSARMAGRRALACALALQTAMRTFRQISVPGGPPLTLALKTTLATGPVRRFLIGDPSMQQIEVLAGAIIARLAAATALTRPGEVVLDPAAGRLLSEDIRAGEWRTVGGTTAAYAVLRELVTPVEPQPWPRLPDGVLSDEQVRPWLLPPVYARLHSGQGEFLTELRHTISLFLRFADLDYDHDDAAGQKLDAFIRWVQHILARYEGWLLQVNIGDKGSYLYATFGAPTAHGDDAARAAGAALELRQIPPDLAYIGQVQIGISGGQSRTGAVGGSTRMYGVMGDATNLAARLMEAAAQGQVLMSANLVPALSNRYLLEPLPPIRVKGKSEQVPIVAIAAAQPPRAIRLQEPQSALPLVGRSAEIAIIEESIARVLRGQGHIICICGEAGIGKSRLISEIIDRAAAAGFVGYGGAAQSTSTQMAYHAWQPIWQAFFDLDLTAPIDERAAALERGLEALDPRLVPRLPLLNMVLALPLPESDVTRSLDARQRKEALEGLLVECLKARLTASTNRKTTAAGADGLRAKPLLLVLEDAHWLDALSLDLLQIIGRSIVGLPVLIVIAYRPPGTERGAQAPLLDLPHSTEIQLGELQHAEAIELIQKKVALSFGPLTRLPTPLIEAIIARTEGNPFYIAELLNYLQDRGIAVDDTEAFEHLHLPGSLSSLILSRIDQLSTERQTTLKVASVIGRLFPVDWLWGVHPTLGPRQQVRQDLDILARLDITPLDTPEPNLRYIFKHATIQEVTYESLPFALRAQLHEQLAAWLESRLEEGVSIDLVAFHYGLSANTEKQREYFRKAGDAAAARYANAVAIRYYERLLSLLPPAEQVPLLITLGRLLEYTSAWEAAEAHYRQALELANGADGAHWRAQAQVGIGNSLRQRALYDEALLWLEEARREFEAMGDRAGVSATLFHRGQAYWYRGKIDMTTPLVEESLAIDTEGNNKLHVAKAYELLGNVALSKQDYGGAREWWLKSLALRREVGDKQGMAASIGNLAIGAFMERRYDEARTLITESIALYHEMGARLWYGYTRVYLGLILAEQGEMSTARQMQAENLLIFRDIGNLPGIDIGLIALAHATQLAEQSAGTGYYAVKLLGAAARIHDTMKSVRLPFIQIIADSVSARARAQLDQIAFDEAWQEGHAMQWQAAIDYALAHHVSPPSSAP